MKNFLLSLLFLSSFLIILCFGANSEQKIICVTIDLCPSSKPYASKLFNYLDALGHELSQPVPVAICVSGKWLEKHQKELEEIKSKYLDITWVNHSYSHPIEDDFLNNPKVDFTREVSANLALMKKYGLKPSKYFCFPGLRHNQGRLRQLQQMGYINLDADAWLAKGEKIKDRSIILVHGNGNEPKGVSLLLAYLKSHKRDILSHKLKIMSLDFLYANN